MNEIANRAATAMAVVDEKTVKDFLLGSGTKLTDQEYAMFLGLAVRNQLDPFKREIYCVKYSNNFSVITAYQVYIERADRTGKLAGWSCTGDKEKAVITICRKDWTQPFVWEATMQEWNKGTALWKSNPVFMLKKTCIAQGFRLAFPGECKDLPFTDAEIEIINKDSATDADILGPATTPTKQQPAAGTKRKPKAEQSTDRTENAQETQKNAPESKTAQPSDRLIAMLDAFGQHGITEMDISMVFGKPLENLTDADYDSLRDDIKKMNAGYMTERWKR